MTEFVNDKLQGLSDKFTQDDWGAIERKFNTFELKVLESQKMLALSDKYEYKQEYNILGEILYCSNRQLLEKPLQLVFPQSTITKIAETEIENKKKKEKKEKEKPQSAKDKIILENSKNRAKTQIETVLKTFGTEFNPKYAFNSDIIEIKGIGLLYTGHYLYSNHMNYNKTKHLSFVYTVMISIERFINNCKKIQGKTLLNTKEYPSSTLLDDLNVWFDKLKSIYTYNGFAICDYAPELLVYTDFDKAIPSMGIRPRNHQIEIMHKIKQYYDEGLLIIYRPPMSSGKTTFIVALCHHIESLRKDNSNVQLIFACNLPPVREHAASLCYNANIKFGIGCKEIIDKSSNKKKYRIINHNSCLKDSDRVAIITSPEIAYDILKDNSMVKNEYVLFVDEPTVGADNENSETLKTNMSVISVAPKRTILSSATFPEIDMIQNITKYISNKYNGIHFDDVYSNEIQIGCDVKTYDFDIVVPHLNIETQSQLLETIDTIKKNPFLGRIYTSDVVRSLWKSMSDVNIQVPDIMKIFSNIDNMSSNKVREIAMELLDILATQNDDIIKKICTSNICVEHVNLTGIQTEEKEIKIDCKNTNNEETNFWNNNDDDENENENENIENPINCKKNSLDFKKLITSQAWIMQNVTLIATKDPMQFVEQYFYNFVHNDIYTHQLNISDEGNIQYYKNTKNILKIYEKELADVNKQRDSFEKSLDKKKKVNSTNKQHDMDGFKEIKDRDIMTKDEIDKKIQEFDDCPVKIKFPDFGHINSKAHMEKYASENIHKIHKKNLRTVFPIELIKYHQFNVPDEILTLLFAGVGIYSMIDKNICPNYTKTVLELASAGLLAYIVSDVSICYGTNYPISRVIVTDDFAKEHSINTLFQLFGRAGRVGRSWIAVIYVSQTIANSIIEYTHKKIKVTVEAENMSNMFDKFMKKKSVMDHTYLNYAITKYILKPEKQKQEELEKKIQEELLKKKAIEEQKEKEELEKQKYTENKSNQYNNYWLNNRHQQNTNTSVTSNVQLRTNTATATTTTNVQQNTNTNTNTNTYSNVRPSVNTYSNVRQNTNTSYNTRQNTNTSYNTRQNTNTSYNTRQNTNVSASSNTRQNTNASVPYNTRQNTNTNTSASSNVRQNEQQMFIRTGEIKTSIDAKNVWKRKD
ncbi:DEXDc helicase [Bodo saltans virus]|uniref:DEXDc helicase n=1 Tax=Bodo saltans virus TaxID=2024608 RepID=A0A2H4UV83_9VIRU|nr:DEXDc helicase [Bodo saltans virus]ATZ80830.1 DEXDc helicase [Bodo saltans virus]